MGKGKISINVFADNRSQPVNKALVEIYDGDMFVMAVETDSSGKTENIVLNCPDKNLSLTPDSKERP